MGESPLNGRTGDHSAPKGAWPPPTSCSTQPCGFIHLPDPAEAPYYGYEEIHATYGDSLDGPHVIVRRGSSSGPVTHETASGTYYFNPSWADSLKFYDVSAYYHVQNSNGNGLWINVNSSKLGKVTVATSAYANGEPAWTTPSQDLIELSSYNSGNWNNPAASAAVVVHEYAHVILYRHNISLGQTSQHYPELRPLAEGLCDFYGILYRQRVGGSSTVMGSYTDLRTGSNYWRRNIDNSANYSGFGSQDNNGNGTWNLYDDSQIISGALWDFYQESPYWPGYIRVINGALALLGPGPQDFWDLHEAMEATGFCEGYDCYDDLDSAFQTHGMTDPVGDPRIASGSATQIYATAEDRNDLASTSDSDANTSNSNELSIGTYPNPSNPTSVIRVNLSESASLVVTAYDLLGHKVATLANGSFTAGIHHFSWDTSSLGSGVYLLVGQSGKSRAVTRILVAK